MIGDRYETKRLNHDVNLLKMAHHEIAAIDAKLIYEWVKIGKFSQKRFLLYLDSVKRMAKNSGFEKGYEEGACDSEHDTDPILSPKDQNE